MPPGITSNRSEREVRGAGLVLQTVWAYKELRRTLEKDGWKKTDFMINLNPPSNNTRTNGGYEDSTLPLIDKGQESPYSRRLYKASVWAKNGGKARLRCQIQVLRVQKQAVFYSSICGNDY